MGKELSSAIGNIPIAGISAGTKIAAISLAKHADDTDEFKDGKPYRQRGRDVFPSRETLSRHCLQTERTTKRQLSDLRRIGLIREYSGIKYRAAYSWNKITQKAAPTCYEFNLSMISRLMDVQFTFDQLARSDMRVEIGDDKFLELYTRFVEVASVEQENDWANRTWTPKYKGTLLQFDSSLSVDDVTIELWDSTNKATKIAKKSEDTKDSSSDTKEEWNTELTAEPGTFFKPKPMFNLEEMRDENGNVSYSDSEYADEHDGNALDGERVDDERERANGEHEHNDYYRGDSDDDHYDHLNEVPVDFPLPDNGLDDYEHYVQSLTSSDAEHYVALNAASEHVGGDYDKEKDDEEWATSSSS